LSKNESVSEGGFEAQLATGLGLLEVFEVEQLWGHEVLALGFGLVRELGFDRALVGFERVLALGFEWVLALGFDQALVLGSDQALGFE
jgi:hypothetical protein